MKPGYWNLIKKGDKKHVILITGETTEVAKKILQINSYSKYSIYSLPLWGMKYKEIQVQQARKCKKIIILEDHLQDGGFGSWFNEALANSNLKTKIKHLYFKSSIIGQVGSSNFLCNKYFKKI